MERPTGVTVIAILYFLVAVFLIGCALLFLLGMGLAGAAARAHDAGPFALLAGLGAVAGVVCLVVAGIAILVGWGLWALKEWARIVAIVLSGLGLAGGLLGLLGMLAFRSSVMPMVGMVGAFFALVRIAINALILWYLLRPDVKPAFA